MTSRIPHLRLVATGAAATLLALALSACADSTSGSGTPAGATGGGATGGGATGGGSSTSSTGGGTSGGGAQPASTITELAKSLVTATAQPTTVHLTVATSGAGATGAAAAASGGSGDVRTGSGGKTEAFSFTTGTSGVSVSLLYVDGVAYVKLPAAYQSGSKPWTKVSANSSNPVIKSIAGSFDQIGNQTSLTQYAALVKSATNFKATGPTTVAGASAQGYSFDIDPKDLPSSKQLGSAVDKLGPIPTVMAVDDRGRPVQVVEKVAVAGQSITTTITFTNYGKAVDISAPPASQTSGG